MKQPSSLENLENLENEDFPPVSYWHQFISRTEADELLEQSLALEWQLNLTKRFSKVVDLSKLELMLRDSELFHYYLSFGVTELRAQPWPTFLEKLRTQAEAATGYQYQVAFGNYYWNGQDSISSYTDDKSSLGPNSAIASISLGGTQILRMMRKEGGETYSYVLEHGDLLLMLPGCQENWVYTMTKSVRNNGARVNWRLNCSS